MSSPQDHGSATSQQNSLQKSQSQVAQPTFQAESCDVIANIISTPTKPCDIGCLAYIQTSDDLDPCYTPRKLTMLPSDPCLSFKSSTCQSVFLPSQNDTTQMYASSPGQQSQALQCSASWLGQQNQQSQGSASSQGQQVSGVSQFPDQCKDVFAPCNANVDDDDVGYCKTSAMPKGSCYLSGADETVVKEESTTLEQNQKSQSEALPNTSQVNTCDVDRNDTGGQRWPGGMSMPSPAYFNPMDNVNPVNPPWMFGTYSMDPCLSFRNPPGQPGLYGDSVYPSPRYGSQNMMNFEAPMPNNPAAAMMGGPSNCRFHPSPEVIQANMNYNQGGMAMSDMAYDEFDMGSELSRICMPRRTTSMARISGRTERMIVEEEQERQALSARDAGDGSKFTSAGSCYADAGPNLMLHSSVNRFSACAGGSSNLFSGTAEHTRFNYNGNVPASSVEQQEVLSEIVRSAARNMGAEVPLMRRLWPIPHMNVDARQGEANEICSDEGICKCCGQQSNAMDCTKTLSSPVEEREEPSVGNLVQAPESVTQYRSPTSERVELNRAMRDFVESIERGSDMLAQKLNELKTPEKIIIASPPKDEDESQKSNWMTSLGRFFGIKTKTATAVQTEGDAKAVHSFETVGLATGRRLDRFTGINAAPNYAGGHGGLLQNQDFQQFPQSSFQSFAPQMGMTLEAQTAGSSLAVTPSSSQEFSVINQMPIYRGMPGDESRRSLAERTGIAVEPQTNESKRSVAEIERDLLIHTCTKSEARLGKGKCQKLSPRLENRLHLQDQKSDKKQTQSKKKSDKKADSKDKKKKKKKEKKGSLYSFKGEEPMDENQLKYGVTTPAVEKSVQAGAPFTLTVQAGEPTGIPTGYSAQPGVPTGIPTGYSAQAGVPSGVSPCYYAQTGVPTRVSTCYSAQAGVPTGTWCQNDVCNISRCNKNVPVYLPGCSPRFSMRACGTVGNHCQNANYIPIGASCTSPCYSVPTCATTGTPFPTADICPIEKRCSKGQVCLRGVRSISSAVSGQSAGSTSSAASQQSVGSATPTVSARSVGSISSAGSSESEYELQSWKNPAVVQFETLKPKSAPVVKSKKSKSPAGDAENLPVPTLVLTRPTRISGNEQHDKKKNPVAKSDKSKPKGTPEVKNDKSKPAGDAKNLPVPALVLTRPTLKTGIEYPFEKDKARISALPKYRESEEPRSSSSPSKNDKRTEAWIKSSGKSTKGNSNRHHSSPREPEYETVDRVETIFAPFQVALGSPAGTPYCQYVTAETAGAQFQNVNSSSQVQLTRQKSASRSSPRYQIMTEQTSDTQFPPYVTEEKEGPYQIVMDEAAGSQFQIVDYRSQEKRKTRKSVNRSIQSFQSVTEETEDTAFPPFQLVMDEAGKIHQIPTDKIATDETEGAQFLPDQLVLVDPETGQIFQISAGSSPEKRHRGKHAHHSSVGESENTEMQPSRAIIVPQLNLIRPSSPGKVKMPSYLKAKADLPELKTGGTFNRHAAKNAHKKKLDGAKVYLVDKTHHDGHKKNKKDDHKTRHGDHRKRHDVSPSSSKQKRREKSEGASYGDISQKGAQTGGRRTSFNNMNSSAFSGYSESPLFKRTDSDASFQPSDLQVAAFEEGQLSSNSDAASPRSPERRYIDRHEPQSMSSKTPTHVNLGNANSSTNSRFSASTHDRGTSGNEARFAFPRFAHSDASQAPTVNASHYGRYGGDYTQPFQSTWKLSLSSGERKFPDFTNLSRNHPF